MIDTLLAPARLQIIDGMTEAIDATNVLAAKLERHPMRIVTRHERANSWIECDDTLFEGP